MSTQQGQPGGDEVTRSILIVDDNESNLRLMQAILDADGYPVKSAIDAEEALALLENWQPKLILMDLQMPGIDGLQLTRRLKREPRYRQIVVVALTAYAMKGDEEKALAAGCDGYITKPIDTRALPSIIQRHFKTPSSPGKGPATKPKRRSYATRNSHGNANG